MKKTKTPTVAKVATKPAAKPAAKVMKTVAAPAPKAKVVTAAKRAKVAAPKVAPASAGARNSGVKSIEVIGARTHNLKNVSVSFPQGELTVITGVSGSGKSSLAFDTLYAEGQRRFVESLSTYARQFIEKMARPDVDAIHNIQPAIAIEQKNRVKNARSSIGTATEIYDYLRLLFAKAGRTICPECDAEVREDSPVSIAADLMAQHANERIYVVAPIPRSGDAADAASAEAMRAVLQRSGYSRLFMPATFAAGERPVAELDAVEDQDARTALAQSHVHVIIDRLVAREDDRDRLTSALALGLQAGHGTVEVYIDTPETRSAPRVYHSGFRCNGCGRNFPRPEPNMFSFNSPLGACPTCKGFGRASGVDWEKVIPDKSLTLRQRPIAAFNSPSYTKSYDWLRTTVDPRDVPMDKPLNEFTDKEWNNLLYGAGKWEGLKSFFDWLEGERYKVQSRIMVARYRGFTTCPDCHGSRLLPAASHVRWSPLSAEWKPATITELTRLSIRDLLIRMEPLKLTAAEDELFGRLYREIIERLKYLSRVGLEYLTLDRQTRTLSGGEAQRINLATALGTNLTQTLYVLDEPTVGLHPRDSLRLLEILKDLRDNGNTIIVVEHDPEIILGADRIVDVGPRAGTHGGEILFSGPAADLINGRGTEKSLTAKFLAPRHIAPSPVVAKKATAKSAKKIAAVQPVTERKIVIKGATEHNLRGVTAEIPLGQWVCVTGVSGSGKSTLIHNCLYQGFNAHMKRPGEDLGLFESIEGFGQLDDIVLVDQGSIGRSTRSNPVTYVKAYDAVRKLFGSTREARALGLTESSFSFNVAGGRCEACEGTGFITYDMHFLAEMTLPCDQCEGRRFSPRVLQVRYNDRNIDDVLRMTVDDACEFFRDQTGIGRKLDPLVEVGLGYLGLGQSTATLSGGEAQRLKLASYLANSENGQRQMLIFDEPTTGLHLSDLVVLSKVFRRLVRRGYSLVIIEHNLEIIREADWILDIGPEAGVGGGQLIAAGPPAHIASVPASHTGRFLRDVLDNEPISEPAPAPDKSARKKK